MTSIEAYAIRRADPHATDWQAVLTLVQSAFASMDGRIDPPSSANRLTAAAIAQQAEEGVVLIAERDGTPVGCVFLTPRSDSMYLGKLAVLPALSRRGLGRRLVDACFKECRERGVSEIELQVRVELTENHAIFSALGFRETGRTAHDGYDRPTSITMRRAV